MTMYRPIEPPICVYGGNRPQDMPCIHISPPQALLPINREAGGHAVFDVDWCEKQQDYWAKPKPNGVRKVSGYAD